MPKVPVYDNFQVTPNTVPQVQVRAPDVPDTVGAQLREQGQAAQRAGDVLNRITLDAVEQVNQVRINNAMNKAVQAKLKLTYDQAEGFTNLKGEAALNRPDGKSLDQEYGEKYQKQLNEIAAGLGNQAQRDRFMAQAGQLNNQFMGSLSQHMAREFTDYHLSTAQGAQATGFDQAALEFDNPESVNQGLNAIRAGVFEEGRLRGWSALQTQDVMLNQVSKAHSAVIASAVDAGMLDYAKEYMEQFKDELTPQVRLQINKVLDEGDFETRTQNKADEILAKFGSDTAKALAEVRATMQGKEEDAVVQRIKAIDNEREALRERSQRSAADRAWQFVAQGKTPPPSLMTALDGRDAVAVRKALTDGPATKTDPNVYYALTQAAANDPNFQQEDLRRYVDVLTPADFKHFVDLQARIKQPAEADQVATVEQQKSALARKLGLKDRDLGIFQMQADRALFSAQKDKGRALDQAERQKVLDNLVIEGEVPGEYFGTNRTRRFIAIEEGREANFKERYPAADIRRATAALQQRGIKKPTPQQIEETLRVYYQQ